MFGSIGKFLGTSMRTAVQVQRELQQMFENANEKMKKKLGKFENNNVSYQLTCYK